MAEFRAFVSATNQILDSVIAIWLMFRVGRVFFFDDEQRITKRWLALTLFLIVLAL